jgi:hypothetical protein
MLQQSDPHHSVAHVAELHEQLGVRDEALVIRVGLCPHPVPLDATRRRRKHRNAAKRDWVVKEERKKLDGDVKLAQLIDFVFVLNRFCVGFD